MRITKLLIVSLIVAPFIASCSNGHKEDPISYHTIKFEGTNCEMHDESGDVVLQKQFEAGQTAFFYLVGKPAEEFDIPKEENVKLTVTGTNNPFDGTFSYNEKDGALSVKMTADVTVTAICKVVDPSVVTADEFNKAISFKDIQYMQFEGIQKGENDLATEFSPDTYHMLTQNDKMYNEEYVKKIGTSYTGIYKYNKTASWGEMDSDEAKGSYQTPATYFGDYILLYMSRALIEFNDLKYNDETKDYLYQTIYDEESFTIKFKFDNKKLISFNIPSLESKSITYEETPVVFPEI